jgi:hypothetical protein
MDGNKNMPSVSCTTRKIEMPTQKTQLIMTQEEKDLLLEKIDSIYGKAVKAGWDYMEGRDDALSELRVFINNMNITE